MTTLFASGEHFITFLSLFSLLFFLPDNESVKFKIYDSMGVYKEVDITYMTVPINKQKPLLSDNFHNSLLINIVIVPKFAILLTGFSPVFQLKDRGIDKVGSRLAFDFPQLVDLVLFIYLLLKLVPSAYRKNLSRKSGTLGMSRYRFG